jgi:acylphosphatase
MAHYECIVRVIISGVVQGVGYRAWTQNAARSRDISGWVRNRADGTVEAVFAGSAEAVASLCEACHRGPRSANVRRVRVEEADAAALAETGGGRYSFAEMH